MKLLLRQGRWAFSPPSNSSLVSRLSKSLNLFVEQNHSPMSKLNLPILALLFLLLATFVRAEENPAVDAVNRLGLSLLRLTEGNALISPWSLQQSLALTYAGARGDTRSE